MLKTLLCAALLLTPVLGHAEEPAAAPAPEAPPVFAPEIELAEGPFKEGETLEIKANFKNISDKPAKVDYYIPYILFPVIRDAERGDVMNVYTPPVDVVSSPKSVTVAPGETFTLAVNKIKLVANNAEAMKTEKLEPQNNSLAELKPGLYVINYALWLGNVNGTPSPPVNASTKPFTVQ